MRRWILASSSPRRHELLSLLGHPFEVASPDVDESPRPDETPEDLVVRLAALKAGACRRPDAVTIAADTVVTLDDRILGKPANPADAARMLRLLAGRTHEVLSGVAVATGEAVHSGIESTAVTFCPIATSEIDAYVTTGEPLDKAGAYGIQGIGGRFVTEIHGNYHNVVGLPLPLLTRLLREAGELV